MSGTIASQDVFLNLATPLTVIGSGGGGSVGPNPSFSTVSALGLLNVSSINGVEYSGSGTVPVNLGVSSLTVNGNPITVLNNTNQPTQGRVILTGADDGFALTAYNNANAVNALIDTVGTSLTLRSGASANPGRIDINATTGVSISTLNVSSMTNVSASVSSLTVSSINGATPPPVSVALGAYSVVIPSFSTPQNNGGGPIINPLYSFSTVVGHTYAIDFGSCIAPIQPSVDPATVPVDNAFTFSIVSGGVATRSDMLPTGSIYNISRGPLSSFVVTTSIPFKATGANASLFAGYLSNNANDFNFTNSTIVSSITTTVLTDYGAI